LTFVFAGDFAPQDRHIVVPAAFEGEVEMELRIGQKVAYPNQGVCRVEELENKTVGGCSISCYLLRVLGDNSKILVPVSNVDSVGIRPVISKDEYLRLMRSLESDFEEVCIDWKIRSRQFQEKLQTGDVFQAADVLKKLTFLSHEKRLSFREQTMLEKARFLIVSEIVTADGGMSDEIESRVRELVECACTKHYRKEKRAAAVAAATVH
jgi:CarD family transcriptional regulator